MTSNEHDLRDRIRRRTEAESRKMDAIAERALQTFGETFSDQQQHVEELDILRARIDDLAQLVTDFAAQHEQHAAALEQHATAWQARPPLTRRCWQRSSGGASPQNIGSAFSRKPTPARSPARWAPCCGARGCTRRCCRPVDPRVKQLETENRRLQRKLQRAETIITLQKKVAEILGIPLTPLDDDETD